MRSNQSFKHAGIRYYLLIESSGKDGAFLLRRDEDKDEDEENDGYYAEIIDMPVHLDLTESDKLPTTLVEELRKLGLAATSYRELASETVLIYSYVDETPGEKWENVCLHVMVDLTDHTHPEVISVPLAKLHDQLEEHISDNHVVSLGISRLIGERMHV